MLRPGHKKPRLAGRGGAGERGCFLRAGGQAPAGRGAQSAAGAGGAGARRQWPRGGGRDTRGVRGVSRPGGNQPPSRGSAGARRCNHSGRADAAAPFLRRFGGSARYVAANPRAALARGVVARLAKRKAPPRLAAERDGRNAALCAPRRRRHAGGAGMRAGRSVQAARRGVQAARAGRAGRKAPPRRAAGRGRWGMLPCVRRASGDTRAARGHESGAGRGRRGRRESGAGRGVRAARAGRAGRKAPPRRAGAGHTGDAALCAPRQRRHAGGAGARVGRGARAARDGVGLGRLGARRGQSRLRVRPASASSRRKFTSDASAASTYVMAAARSTFFAASDSSYVT